MPLTLEQMKQAPNPSWLVYPALHSAGYIEVTEGLMSNLTEKGRREAANWEAVTRYNGQTEYRFATANREVIEVTGVSESQETNAEATFTWRWKPINEIGTAMNLQSQTHQGKALFQKYDDGWRVTAVSTPE